MTFVVFCSGISQLEDYFLTSLLHQNFSQRPSRRKIKFGCQLALVDGYNTASGANQILQNPDL